MDGSQFSEIVRSISEAANVVAAPNWVDVMTHVPTLITAIATIVMVLYTKRSSDAALQQAKEAEAALKQELSIALYTPRKGVFDIVCRCKYDSLEDMDSSEASLGAIAADMRLLFPDSNGIYKKLLLSLSEKKKAAYAKSLLISNLNDRGLTESKYGESTERVLKLLCLYAPGVDSAQSRSFPCLEDAAACLRFLPETHVSCF